MRRGQEGAADAGEVYVSIILAARNDGHEGNFMLRLQTSLDQLAARCETLSLLALLSTKVQTLPADVARPACSKVLL